MRESNDIVTVLGIIGTDPEQKTTPSGVPLLSFRLASTARKFDKSSNSWIDGNTNWYTVTAFRTLAVNATNSLRKGDPVVVTGRLQLRAWNNGEKQGIAIDLQADVIGLDLQWGTARYQRNIRSAPISEGEPDARGEAGAAIGAEGASISSPDWGAPAHHGEESAGVEATYEENSAALAETPF